MQNKLLLYGCGFIIPLKSIVVRSFVGSFFFCCIFILFAIWLLFQAHNRIGSCHLAIICLSWGKTSSEMKQVFDRYQHFFLHLQRIYLSLSCFRSIQYFCRVCRFFLRLDENVCAQFAYEIDRARHRWNCRSHSSSIVAFFFLCASYSSSFIFVVSLRLVGAHHLREMP